MEDEGTVSMAKRIKVSEDDEAMVEEDTGIEVAGNETERKKCTNWFTSLIIPSARAIASVSGKIVSAIFSDNDSSSEDEYSISDNDNKQIDALVDTGASYNPAPPAVASRQDGKASETPSKPANPDNNELIRPSQQQLLMSTALQLVQDEGGSRVDVARSYMQDRPPWASPTKKFELGTPSTTTMKLLNEGTGSGHGSLSSSKKQNSLASGSGNIQLRRVHSKAIEDMLRTPPSKIDQSLFAAAKTQRDSAGASEVISVVGGETSIPVSFRNKQIDALVDTGASYDPALPAVAFRQDGKASETPSNPANPGNNGTLEAAFEMDECVAAPNVSHPSSPTHTGDQHTEYSQQPALCRLPEFRRFKEAYIGDKSKRKRENRRPGISVNYAPRRKRKRDEWKVKARTRNRKTVRNH